MEKKITWTTSTGKEVVVTVEAAHEVKDNIVNADGDKINLGQVTEDALHIVMTVDGKVKADTTRAPQVLTLQSCGNYYGDLIAKGAYARLGDTYIARELYDLIMAAIRDAWAEADTPEDYLEIKARIALEAAQKAAQARKAKGDYQRQLDQGLCPKCGTYCYGDCDA